MLLQFEYSASNPFQWHQFYLIYLNCSSRWKLSTRYSLTLQHSYFILAAMCFMHIIYPWQRSCAKFTYIVMYMYNILCSIQWYMHLSSIWRLKQNLVQKNSENKIHWPKLFFIFPWQWLYLLTWRVLKHMCCINLTIGFM